MNGCNQQSETGERQRRRFRNDSNFAPRIKVPVLMLNGPEDFGSPVETSQDPLFERLGSPQEQKKHVILEGGHAPPRMEAIRHILGWLDKYLGSVH